MVDDTETYKKMLALTPNIFLGYYHFISLYLINLNEEEAYNKENKSQ